jgi:hypothetical protein
VAAGTSLWRVPVGTNAKIVNVRAIINSSAVTGGVVNVIVAAGVGASMTSGSMPTQGRQAIMQAIVSAGPTMGVVEALAADVPTGNTIAVMADGATSYLIGGIVIQGYLY